MPFRKKIFFKLEKNSEKKALVAGPLKKIILRLSLVVRIRILRLDPMIVGLLDLNLDPTCNGDTILGRKEGLISCKKIQGTTEVGSVFIGEKDPWESLSAPHFWIQCYEVLESAVCVCVSV